MAAMAVTIPACSSAALRADVSKILRLSTPSSSRIICSVSQTVDTVSKQDALEHPHALSRRNLLLASGFASLVTCNVVVQEEALAAASVAVGTFLPPAGVDDFVVFTPSLKATPALRAGNVSPYSFFIPPKWTQVRIANILSGNYCQPKCAEPWIEVKFEYPSQGLVQVVASPIVRLTNKPEATIQEIGPPEKIIAALGQFVTGDSFDPEEVVETSVREADGQTYYTYTLDTPFALSGQHSVACATAKGNSVLLMVASATDKQWATSEPVLRKMIESFRV